MNNLSPDHAFSGGITQKLTPSEILALVSSHPFLKDVAPAHQDLMATAASLEEFQAGEMIFKQGDPARRFYLIVFGSVALTHAGLKGNVPIQTLSAGDPLGWSWLFPPHAWHFNAMATEPTRTIVFDGEKLRELAKLHPDFGYVLMEHIAHIVIERLQQTRRRFHKLSGMA